MSRITCPQPTRRGSTTSDVTMLFRIVAVPVCPAYASLQNLQFQLPCPNPRVLKRPYGPMDNALVFRTKNCRFESCQGQIVIRRRRITTRESRRPSGDLPGKDPTPMEGAPLMDPSLVPDRPAWMGHAELCLCINCACQSFLGIWPLQPPAGPRDATEGWAWTSGPPTPPQMPRRSIDHRCLGTITAEALGGIASSADVLWPGREVGVPSPELKL